MKTYHIHIFNLFVSRFSTSCQSSSQTNSDVTKKQATSEVTRHESSIAFRKTERSLSPRRRPISVDFNKNRVLPDSKRNSMNARIQSTGEQTNPLSASARSEIADWKPESPSCPPNLHSCSTSYNEKYPPEKPTLTSQSDYVARFCKV